MTVVEDGVKEGTARFNAPEGANKVSIKLGVLFIFKFTKIEINGVDYSGYIPKTPEELAAAFSGQTTWVSLVVDRNFDSDTGKESYVISTEVADADAEKGEIGVGNFLWTYNPANEYRYDDMAGKDVLNDDYIGHGHMELVAITNNNITYTWDDEENNISDILDEGSAMDWYNPLDVEDYGSAVLPAGSLLTVKLVPEYGYQLTEFTINGSEFTAEDEPSVFTFEIKPGNFHLGAHFTEVDDVVKSGTTKVSDDSTIVLGEEEIKSGTAILEINDTTAMDTEKVEELIALFDEYEDYGVVDQFDIDLKQVWYRGKDDDSDIWYEDMTELDNECTITLAVTGNYTNPSIVHQLHTEGENNEYEILDASYDEDEGTITFKTDGFSNYAIIDERPYVVFYALGGYFGDDEEDDYCVSYIDEDGHVELPKNPKPGDKVPEGAEFYGWYSANVGKGKITNDTVFTETTAVRAIWRTNNVIETENEVKQNKDNKTDKYYLTKELSKEVTKAEYEAELAKSKNNVAKADSDYKYGEYKLVKTGKKTLTKTTETFTGASFINDLEPLSVVADTLTGISIYHFDVNEYYDVEKFYERDGIKNHWIEVVEEEKPVKPEEPSIVGICQIPNPYGGGALIGFEPSCDGNDYYVGEILLLDCTKLAAGDSNPWFYSTGKRKLTTGGVWTQLPLPYGYYWTLFRIYDKDGNLVDEECYGFVNI